MAEKFENYNPFPKNPTNRHMVAWYNVLDYWEDIGKMLKEINTVTEFCAKSGTSKEILDVNVFIQLIPMDENGAIIGGYGPTLCDRADLRDNKGDKIRLSFRKEKLKDDLIAWQEHTKERLFKLGIKIYPVVSNFDENINSLYDNFRINCYLAVDN